MVNTIGRISAKKNLTPEDILQVINAVEHYASKKKVVPNSEIGKNSLNLGFSAIKAVAGSPEARQQFLEPHKANITRLQNNMLQKNLITEDMLTFPQQKQPAPQQPVRGM